MLHPSDLEKVNKLASKAVEKFKNDLEGTPLEHLDVHISFHTPAAAIDCPHKILVNDGNGNICLKCPGDTSPCP